MENIKEDIKIRLIEIGAKINDLTPFKEYGGTSYEILYASLEPEIQEKLDDDEIFSRALVPYEEKPRNTFVAENARLTAYARIDIIYALENIRKKYPTKKEADNTFLEMYNSGMYLPKVFKFIGTISIGTLYRWVKAYEDYGTEALVPKRRSAAY